MPTTPEIKPEQSIELLKKLHILTRDGKLNQDSRRKLKQVYHLYHFIEPLLVELWFTMRHLMMCCRARVFLRLRGSAFPARKVT